MKIKFLLFICLAYILLSAYYFEGGEASKKKKLLKAAKWLLLGAALKGKKTIIPIPIPLPIPFKSEKHIEHIHQQHIPYPVYKPYPEPIFIHDSYGGYHDNFW